MRLVDEIVAYCDRRGMLSGEQLARLREMGLDESDYLHKKWFASPERYENNEDYYRPDWEWDYWDYYEDWSDDDLTEEQARLADAQRAIRRKSGGGGKPVRKKTTAPELDALLAPLLDAMFADDALSCCVVKLGARAGIKETSNVRDAASSLARLSESELLTALTQALDASGCDRLSLNDVYAAILVWPDLTFLKERGGPAVDACRTLLREDYELGVASRDAWLLGESNAVRDLYWFRRFKRGLIAALRTVYETDKATFKRWSTDGGRLPFPGWDEAKKVDTTCWRVWEPFDQTPREVSYAEWEATLARVNSPRTLALRLTLTDSLAFDFSHLTVVDGDYEQFKDAANKPTVAQPPLFSAVQTLCLENADDEEVRRLKSLPNLQTLTFGGYSSNVTDAGLSSLSCCANLQTLKLQELRDVTDAGLSSLSGCANLQTLTLRFLSKVTDAGLSSLSGCANLQTLGLCWLDGVTGAGLSSLSSCANLQTLTLEDLCDVTNAGLSSLSSCANLRSIEIWKCGWASEAGVAALRKRLPNCEIRFTPIR